MISRKEALEAVLANVVLMPAEHVSLDKASGRVLAADVVSPIAHPIFDQSAMDGYCFSHAGYLQSETLELCGAVQAGGSAGIAVGPGQCARIFTGAEIPSSCDTVCMQEQTKADGNQITFTNRGLKSGANVRRKGEQLKKGDLALPEGALINAAAIGFFASLGIAEVRVTRRPRVQIICTGNEFAGDEADLVSGMVYESNGIMLAACLEKLGIGASVQTCVDSLEDLTGMIRKIAGESDVILITGGVSVGDYDYTKPALEASGFEQVFHKVSQKPGKPLLFSKSGSCAAFGLPGNPQAALICFHQYVKPYLLGSMGSRSAAIGSMSVPLAEPYRKKDDKRTHFLPAVIRNGKAVQGTVQGSHMLASMAASEGLVVINPEGKTYAAGEMVEFIGF